MSKSPGPRKQVRPAWAWGTTALGIGLLCYAVAMPVKEIRRKSKEGWTTKRSTEKKVLHPVMVILPPGRFQMGSMEPDKASLAQLVKENPRLDLDTIKTVLAREHPQHEVVITKRFAISETEVTQAQYKAVMGENPSDFKDAPDWADRPVENVSWLDAVRYCNKLSEMEGLKRCYEFDGDEVRWNHELACEGYRLPTEAEWEYAARAQGTTEYAGSNRPDEVAWYDGNSDQQTSDFKKQTHPVGKRKANAWGLQDMSGNVWEWVWDWFGADYYKESKREDPTGPKSGSNRVYRGGSWGGGPFDLRVAIRGRYSSGIADDYLGFRLSRSYP